jgi:hypothetical protein
MSDNIVAFPGLSPKRGRANPVSSEPREEAPGKADSRLPFPFLNSPL